MSKEIQKKFVLGIQCLVHTKVRPGYTETTYKVHNITSDHFLRPEQGTKPYRIECPHCRTVLNIEVESIAGTRKRRRIYSWTGGVMLGSLILWVPPFLNAAGQTTTESNSSALMQTIEIFFPLSVVCFIAGTAFLASGLMYRGLRRFRVVRQDGRLVRIAMGHKVNIA